jgi:alpha,alpha-trehalose phosphorylase
VVNVINGKLIRLLVDDEPFEIRYGRLHEHERLLDLRAEPAGCTGVRRPAVRCVSSPRGSSRSPSAPSRRSATRSNPSTAPLRIVVQSELVANESLPALSVDPRTAAVLESPLVMEENVAAEHCAMMIHPCPRHSSSRCTVFIRVVFRESRST